MKLPIPAAALAQHTAILGKTGSGKTTTAKVVIEHVVDEGARVCVLDPIKSDWWGLTSSADGKHPGLPFQILGGPRGHVPLHSGAGRAIGGVVASGALPLSILDMADFEPGGQQKFFADFARVLLQKMRGVLYLVVEEAHLFAPKERAGFGAENMAIHYAKLIATAGRSKGVRLIVLTQRVQALHNAILGSCETLIALRLTAPADQEPVVKWLRSNVADKDLRTQIETTLGGVRTGSGWVCSGEAKVFELVDFPRALTYDNTRTPDQGDAQREIKTAPVDADKLRSIIGDAVKEAERDDPRVLRAQVATLQRELAAKAGRKPEVDVDALARAKLDGFAEGHAEAVKAIRLALQRSIDLFQQDVVEAFSAIPKPATRPETPARRSAPSTQKVLEKSRPSPRSFPVSHSSHGNGAGEKLSKAERLVLTALAQYPGGRTKVQVAVITGYAHTGGGFNNALSSLRSRGLIEGEADRLAITEAGGMELGDFEPLPTGQALLEHWMRQLSKAERGALLALVNAYPKQLAKEEVAAEAGYEPNGGGFNNALSRLRTLELISGRGELRASEDLIG